MTPDKQLVPDTDERDSWEGWFDENGNAPFRPTQRIVFKNALFDGMAEIMRTLCEATQNGKRLRIIVEYDPQAVNASLTCYQLRHECMQDQSLRNPQEELAGPK